MQIAQQYAGFTLGKADILRRAMSKKNATEMQKMEVDFLAGALERGHDEDKAREIFAMMVKFAGYGFNRSHAYAYSALAFQLAYFKAHYPDVFFAIMLNYSSSEYISDALQFGFRLAPLSINTVPYHDKFDQNAIFMGLKNLKGLPKDFLYWIIENRPFTSVEETVLRLPEQYRKKEWLTPLIQLGLFDEFEPNRKKIVENLDNLFVFADAFGSFFAEEAYSWVDHTDYTDSEKYELEQALIGVGVSPHLLVRIARDSFYPFKPIADLLEGERTTVLVQIQQIRQIRTKKGELMAFLQVTDTKQKLDVTIFPETYQKVSETIKEGLICYLHGRVQRRDERLQLLLEGIEEPSQEKFWILVENEEHDQEIASILRAFPGTIPVIVHYENTNKTIQIRKMTVQKTSELGEALHKVTLKTVFR